MIKKKLLSVLTATVLLSSLFATTAFAAEWNEQGGTATIEGSTYPVVPVIEVAIPGDLTFGINPLNVNVSETDTPDTRQIVAADYAIINYSNVRVVIGTETTATATSGVTLMDTAAYDTNSDELEHSDSTKNMFLCFSVNKTAAFDAETGFAFTYGTMSSTVKDAATAKAEASAVMESGTAVEALFMLKAASENMDGAAASFTLQGAVDPQSTFVEGDVTVKTVYTLTAITEKQYDGSYEADDAFTGAAATSVKAK
ncbi:MAG: hypothetical protein ACI4D0_02290 [Lachnospira sp.]